MFNKPRWSVEDWSEYIYNAWWSYKHEDDTVEHDKIEAYQKYIESIEKLRDLTEQEEKFREAYLKTCGSYST